LRGAIDTARLAAARLKGRSVEQVLAALDRVIVNRAGILMLPGHVFVGAGVDVVLWNASQRRITASVQLSNIFNVQGQDLDGYPLPGRAVFATLALALGEAVPTTAHEGEAPR